MASGDALGAGEALSDQLMKVAALAEEQVDAELKRIETLDDDELGE
ncbi:MAG: hypothetical protein GY738_03585 [Pseudoalteromonas sp.]|nr:hypothetical protein [Pseudoalteromonas sp.]